MTPHENPKIAAITPGCQFGLWTTCKNLGRDQNGRYFWECQCQCGITRSVQSSSLVRGISTNCGCVRRAKTIARNTTHGLRYAAEWYIWKNMIQRCTNPKTISYQYYGARGIKVCKRWLNSFSLFYLDMGQRPTKDHKLDRKNNNGNYTPRNCRWISQKEQMRNMRKNHLLTYNGETKTIAEWAEQFGLPASVLYMRAHRGWSDEKILSRAIGRWADRP